MTVQARPGAAAVPVMHMAASAEFLLPRTGIPCAADTLLIVVTVHRFAQKIWNSRTVAMDAAVRFMTVCAVQNIIRLTRRQIRLSNCPPVCGVCTTCRALHALDTPTTGNCAMIIADQSISSCLLCPVYLFEISPERRAVNHVCRIVAVGTEGHIVGKIGPVSRCGAVGFIGSS
jgi:hypothetical protein